MEMAVYGTFIMRTLVMGQVEHYLLPLQEGFWVKRAEYLNLNEIG